MQTKPNKLTPDQAATVRAWLEAAWPSDSTADQRLGYRIQLLKRALGHVYRTLGIEPADGDVARLLDLPFPAGDAANKTDGSELFDEIPY